jgi:hypothetical protein
MEGGKIGPISAEEAVTAAANGASKPRSRIALISTRPRPPTSASAAPEIPEKIRLARMFTCASPPCSRAASTLAKRKMRSVMPARFIRLPTKMNTGTATSGKLSSA